MLGEDNNTRKSAMLTSDAIVQLRTRVCSGHTSMDPISIAVPANILDTRRYPSLNEVANLPTDAAGNIVYDAIVIGAGVGGLSAAAQMVAKGAKVLVLEK